MIYELSVVCHGDATDEMVKSVAAIVKEVVDGGKGQLLVEDNWGRMYFAQPTSSGQKKANYLYFMYQGDGQFNTELERRLGINESVLRQMVIQVGDDTAREVLVKGYKTPFSKAHPGSVVDQENQDDMMGLEEDMGGKDRGRKFSRRKGCWFTARKIRADWKDPATFAWLINEFGKISPARVSGISRKHQRYSNSAIKRARQVGLASHLSDRISDHV